MEKPKKKLPVQHMPSQLLSQEANDKFFNLLEARTQALCTAFVNVVMSKPPERPEWKPFRTGVATLIKDHTRKSYYIQIYDLVDWAKAREEELKKGSTYHVSLPTFHQLETSTGKAMGLKFSLEKEAKTFAQIARDITMTGHYKSDGPSLTANANDEISAGGTPGERTTTATLTPPRPPPAKKTSTLSRPQRPKSMHREAPKSPPPPPPPSLKRNPVTTVPIKAPPPSPPTPPPPKAPSPQSLPSTPVNRDAPALIAGPFPVQSSVPSSPGPTTDTLDRKKPTKKITKEMIGVPTNFQHVSHVGFDPELNFDSQKIQETVSELAKRTSATCPTTSNPLPSNPPPPNPPPSNPPPPNPPPSNPPPPNPPPSNPPPPNPPPSNPPRLNPPPSNPPQPPGNRNPVCSPASDASPPKPEEAALIVSSEPSREKEQTLVCEKPRAGALEALPTSAATPSATQVNDAIHYDTKLVEEVAARETAVGNKPETQAILLSEEPVHKAASDTSDEVRRGHVEETFHRTSVHDSLTECNSDFEMVENSRNSDPVQSAMQPSDVLDVDPIPNTTTTSLDSSLSLGNNLIAKSNAFLVGPDQECRKNENGAEKGANSVPTLSANELDKYNTDILNSLNELEAMLEGVSTSSSSDSVPSQTTAASEVEIRDGVTHSASEDAGEEQESVENLGAQTNISSTSVPTSDPDQVGHESFDPLEMNMLLEGATVHSNFIFSDENLQIPVAPTRYRRKKSKQEPSPPPPPPTPTEADQIDSENL